MPILCRNLSTSRRDLRRQLARIATATLIAAYGIAAHAESNTAPDPSTDATQTAKWQALAQAELDAVHTAIVSVHPGMIDAQNPAFPAQVEDGYREAQAMVPKVFSYDSAIAVASYYAASFNDGHLAYSNEVRTQNPIYTSGWVLEEVDGKYRVAAVAADWPVPLPPGGAVLLDCDGRAPYAIVRQDIARYWSRRDNPALLRQIAALSNRRYPGNEALKSCRFQSKEGDVLERAVVYRPMPAEAYGALQASAWHPQVARKNSSTRAGDVLWIHAANFMLQPDEARELDIMLAQLAQQKGVTRIVFDLRGNNGGDSGIGDRIIAAATGGLMFDQRGLDKLPQTYAQWRISDIMQDRIKEIVAIKTRLYGADAAQTQQVQKIMDDAAAAKAAGKAWYRQDDGPRITPEEMARRHARPMRFKGKIAVVTDSRCASACLDFVDSIRLIPGAIQVGAATSSDTNYLEVVLVPLPSGNHLAVPMKVWRNRLRGSAEPWVPNVAFDFDINDDARVQEATLRAMVGIERK